MSFIKNIYGNIEKRIEKISYSNGGNKKTLEKRIDQNKEFYDKILNLYIDNIKLYRTNLLVLAGGLITFLSFAYNNNSNKTVLETSFKLGFFSTFLAIIFAVIIATVLATVDIYLIRNKILFVENFHIKIIGFLGKIKKTELSKEEADEYNKINQEYNSNLKKLNGKLLGIFDNFFNIGFIISLIVGLTSFLIYYSGVLKIL